VIRGVITQRESSALVGSGRLAMAGWPSARGITSQARARCARQPPAFRPIKGRRAGSRPWSDKLLPLETPILMSGTGAG
jgi:hypothetical protein